MDDHSMNRKEFLTNAGKLCACSCVGAMLGGLQFARGEDTKEIAPQPTKKPRSEERMEFNVIHFQYTSAAETGLPSGEGACLCPLVETKPPGLSATYCLCSVGYVKQMHEMYFRQPVEVELLDSVLRGGPRCRFKITVV